MRSKRLPQGLEKTKKRKMIKQILIIGLSLFVCFSQMSLAPLGKAYADTNSSGTSTNPSFLDAVKLMTGDAQSGTEVSTTNPLTQGETVNLEYSWSKKADQQLAANQPITFKIPDTFKVDQDVTEKYISDHNAVTTDDGKTIGTFAVVTSDAAQNANTATITFDDSQLKDLNTANGTIIIPVTYNDSITADGTKSITFDLGNNQTTAVDVARKADIASSSSASSTSSDAASSSNTATTDNGSSSNSSTSGTSSTTGSSSDQTTATSGDSSSTATGTNTDSALSATSDSTTSGTSTSATNKVVNKSLFTMLDASSGKELTSSDFYLTDVTIKDNNGQAYSSTNRPGVDSPANIYMNWEVPNTTNINSGDYYTFKLPEQFAIYNDIPNADGTPGELKDQNGDIVGTYIITPDENNVGTVKIVFNGAFTGEHSDISGTIDVHTQFNSQEIIGNVQQSIIFPINGKDQAIVIPFKTTKVTDIDKSGSADQPINPQNINWIVNVNKTGNSLTNAVVKDTLPDGLTLNKDSIKVFKITQVNIDGTVTTESNPIDAYTVVGDNGGSNLEIDFDNNKDSNAYQIQYSTAISDSTKDGSFYNTATLSSNGNNDASANATVTTSTGPHLTKSSSYDKSTQKISWTINYNGDNKAILDGTVLHDLFDNSQILVSDSIKVYHATVNNDQDKTFSKGDPVDSGESTYTVSPTSTTGKNGFDLTFHGSGNSGPYQITYQTKADGLVTSDGTVNNSVTENLGTPVPAKQTIQQQGIIKTNTGADYANKTTTWQLKVNGNNYTLKDAKIIDSFDDKGLNLQPSSLKVYDNSTNTFLTEGSDYEINSDSDGNGFTIDFSGGNYKTTNDSFTITYTTDFNYSQLTSTDHKFYNTSTLKWTDENGNNQQSSDTATFNPGDYTKANGFKNGSYDPTTKQITWNIGINYNKTSLTDPIVTDQLQDGQKYVPGSLHVYKMNLTKDQDGYTTDSIEFTNYTPSSPSPENDNTLTVKFNQPINEPYYITFKTSLEDQIVNNSYNNTASFRDGTGPVTNLTASVQPINTNQFVTKTGSQGSGTDADKVNWSVVINPSQSTISQDVVLKDAPLNNQIIIPGSFVLYPATYSTGGVLQKGSGIPLSNSTTVIDPNNSLQGYTLNIDNSQANVDGTQTFSLKFNSGISSTYVLEYQTLINANNGDQLTNSATLTGSNIQTITTPASYPVTVKYSTGSATASGTSKGLQVIKKDGDNPDASPADLQGAEFELKGTGVLEGLVDRTATTGTDGIATFKNLKYGTYTLTETKAPNGYLDGLKDGETITINSSSPTNSSNYVTTTVNDLKPVIFYKYDTDTGTNDPLSNAEYQLQKQGGGDVSGFEDKTFTTNKYGNFAIDNLPEGNYQLVETKAPYGYYKDSTPIPFSITAENDPAITNKQIKITGADKIIPGAAVITKTDATSGLLLSGATFSVYTNKACTIQAKDNDGNPISDVTTEDGGTTLGTVEITNLRPGTYYLKEKTPPTDYQLNTNPIKFNVALGQGEASPTAVPITDTLKTGSVILTKVGEDDTQTGLQGATFDLYDSAGTKIKSGYVTNNSGIIKVDGLAPGGYHFVETAPPVGYVLDTTHQDFTIVRSQAAPISIVDTNSLKTGSVILTKVGEDDTNTGLKGAVYDFYNSKGYNVEKTTDDKGQIKIDGLKPGTYSYVEKSAPNDYQVDSTVKTFTIIKNQTQAIGIKETDSLTPGSVTLTKYDSEDQTKTLQGAKFDLLGSDQSTVIRQDLTTDENGKISVDGLKPGTYYFKEIKAPTNYDVNNDLIKAVVEKGQISAESVDAYDTLTPGSARLIKKASEDHKTLLPGAEYKLVRLDSAGKQVWVKEHLVTDSYGQITVDGLAPGQYQFIETTPPVDYQLDSSPIDVTVAPGQKSVDDATVTAYDTLTPGNAHITKTDELTGKGLSGAEFNVIDSSNNTVRSDVATDKDGTVTVKDLAPGDYQLQEIKAPIGYSKSIKNIPFTIDKGQIYSKEVSMTDKMLPGSIALTKVDGAHPSNKLGGAEYQLLDAGGVTPAVDNDGNTIANQTTDKNGSLAFSNLRPGTYKLKEITAPAGFQKNDNLISVPVDASTIDNTSPEAQKITVEDFRGMLKIIKTDTEGAGLSGAVFSVTGPEGTFQMTTGSDGTATIGDLAPGAYKVQETNAPEGYLVNAQPQTFSISDENKDGIQEASTQLTFADLSNGVTLNKTDGSKALKGAVFKLFDSNGAIVEKDANGKTLQNSWTTDSNGQIKIYNLKTGYYQFVEVNAPNGYQVNTKPYKFKINNTDEQTLSPLTATNDLNAVTLTKSDVNDKRAVLAGAQFKLENSLGTAVTSDINGHALPAVWTTDADGQFTVHGLPTGSYQFVETKAPDGYLLDATPVPFEVTNTLAAALPIIATDKENTVTLTKIDKNDNNIHLQGAEFALQDSNGNSVTKDAAGNSLSTTWTTDSNGQFTVSGLAPGSYQFVETKAPANYDLDATPIPFKITDTDISSQELTATDKLSPGSVQLTKVDKNDTSIHLQGATFKLQDRKGNAVTKDSDGKALSVSWTTDSNGLLTVGNLAPGDYQFIETKAPYGYDLDATPIPFTIAKGQQKAVGIMAPDKLTPGDVRLTKVDANDKNAVLKGAVFKLEDSNGATLKMGLTTDNNGQFVIKGLAPGKYFFIETKAPTGYQLDDTPIPFTIEKGQAHAVEITVKDKPEPIVIKGKPGVVYNVVDNHGHIIRRGVMADEQGNVIIKGLKPGSYHLVRAVEAYVSSPTSKKTSGNLPTTGDTNDLIGMAAGLVLLLCGGGLAFFARRRGDN